MKPPAIPMRYRAHSPKDLEQDLGRMAIAMVNAAKAQPTEEDIVPAVREIGATKLAIGSVTRVSPIEDQFLQLELRKPRLADAGRSLFVMRQSTLGAVEIVCIDCTLNGYTRLLLLGDVRVSTIMTDGANYFMDNAGALNWGTGL